MLETIKAILKMRWIVIDSRAGQSEDCTRASWGLKQWPVILFIFNLPVLILLKRIFCLMSQMKSNNFPRKIAIHHLIYLFLPSNRPKHNCPVPWRHGKDHNEVNRDIIDTSLWCHGLILDFQSENAFRLFVFISTWNFCLPRRQTFLLEIILLISLKL